MDTVVIEESVELTASTQERETVAREGASCCSQTKQATCCEPSEKASCCGEAASGSCGCQ
jgi:hypothetical protein